MTNVPQNSETVNPDNVADRVSELRGDRKVFASFMLGGLALAGAGAAGVYSLVTGDHVPIVGSVIPGTGALTAGAVLTIPGAAGVVKTTQEIHRLTQQ